MEASFLEHCSLSQITGRLWDIVGKFRLMVAKFEILMEVCGKCANIQ